MSVTSRMESRRTRCWLRDLVGLNMDASMVRAASCLVWARITAQTSMCRARSCLLPACKQPASAPDIDSMPDALGYLIVCQSVGRNKCVIPMRFYRLEGGWQVFPGRLPKDGMGAGCFWYSDG